MAVFADLPAELLLQVTYHLSDDTKSLRHLSLTSQWLLPPAQETLHRDITVENNYADPGSPRKTVSQSYQLIRTFFARPDLARMVRVVRLNILEWLEIHSPECKKSIITNNARDLDLSCSCEYAKIRELCTMVIHGMEMRLWLAKKTPHLPVPRQQRYQNYRRWLQASHSGYESVLMVLLLHLLPCLESLFLGTYHSSGQTLGALLGDGDRIHNFSPGLVAGLSSLQSLTTTFLPPWSVVTLPTLRTLHIKIGHTNTTYELKYGPEEAGPHQLPNHIAVCTNISTLIMDLEIAVLTRNLSHHEDDVYGSLRYLVTHSSALTHVEIRLFYDETQPHHADLDESEVLSYGDLMPLLQIPPLETLVIDTSNVNWNKYADNGTGRPYETWQAEGVEPLDLPNFGWRYTIPELINLRRLALPQESLFFHYRSDSRFDFITGRENFLPCALPLSVEIVEVIDSTRMLNHWANYVLEHPHQFPSLRQVVLWCDRLTTPLSHDKRFRQESANGIDHEEVEARGEYKLDDEVGDEVWIELQKIGVELVVKSRRERGWRFKE